MRILHTSDWHLGKSMYEISMLEDQKVFLEQLVSEVQKGRDEKNPYSALIIAGDIYDRQIPPEDATEVLSGFLYEFSEKFPETHIFIISGNHDSAGRLSFASQFFHRHNIHIVTDTKKITEPFIIKNAASGKDDSAAFYLLPYLLPNSLKSSENPDLFLKKQQELYDEACTRIRISHEKNHPELPSVLVCHPFALGSIKAGSERSSIGETEQVDIRTFKGFTYCAFGHIHGFHVCDGEKRCYYSGAPLSYHVDDSSETFMLDVEIKGSAVPEERKIQIKPLHPVVKLEGTIQEFTDGGQKWKAYKESYVFAVLTDQVMVPDAHARLKPVFPNLVNVKPKERSYGNRSSAAAERKTAMESKDIGKIFTQFLSDVEGENYSKADDETKKLYEQEMALLKDIAKEMKWGENL